jgi:hypothetical protein
MASSGHLQELGEKMKKQIAMSVDSTYGTATLLAGLPLAANWHCDVFQALLVVGLLTTPPRYRGISLSTYWAWLRYGAAISSTDASLRLRPIWDELDPHQKTLLADDFGMGFPCQYLIEQHGFEDFADTSYLLDSLLSGVVSHVSRSKRGPSKTPDFICVDSSNRLHILECKGTQTSRHYLDRALSNGVDQKNNLSNGSIFASCMVGGLFIPQARSSEHAQMVFIDPKPHPALKLLLEMDPMEVARAVRRQSFAKALGTAGLWVLAGGVASGGVGQSEANFVRNLAEGELRFNEFSRTDQETWQRTIEYRSLESDAKGVEARDAFVTRLVIDVPDEVVKRVKYFTSASGKVDSSALDAWLEEQLVAKRKTTTRTIFEQSQTSGRFLLRRRKISSVWTMFSSDRDRGESASITVSSGIKLTLERIRFA